MYQHKEVSLFSTCPRVAAFQMLLMYLTCFTIYNVTIKAVGVLRAGVEWARALAQGAHRYNFPLISLWPR